MAEEEKRVILVVDDDADVLHTTKAILKKDGFNVLTAPSGYDCLNMLDGVSPDLVLLDVMMPDMDGWSTCTEIKKKENSKDIPVVMLTVKIAEEDMSRSFKHFADGHVGKPIIKEKLVETIKWVLKSRGKV